MPIVLVVDDEVRIRDVVRRYLEHDGYQVLTAAGGAEALEIVARTAIDLIVLDLRLADIGGEAVAREIRRTNDVPIVMLTAKVDERDRIGGLEAGADDYVTKPFRLRELIARVRAALRRIPVSDQEVDPADVIEIGQVRLDVGRHEVFVRGMPMAFPLKEFELLEILLTNAGRVLTRDVLIDRIWGPNYFGDTKTLDVHVKRLRSKIEIDPANPKCIVTVRGVGYRYERAAAVAS